MGNRLGESIARPAWCEFLWSRQSLGLRRGFTLAALRPVP